MVRAVGVGDARAPLESDVVILGRAEPVERVQVRDLARVEPENGVGVQPYQVQPAAAGPFYAGAGDIMRVGGQPLPGEQLPAGVHHPLVEHVHVLQVDPRPDAVLLQRAALAFQRACQPGEDRPGLGLSGGRAAAGAEPGAPKVAQPVLFN